MPVQELMLNDNANFVFRKGNKVYKLCVNIHSGLITLEELHKDEKERDMLQVFSLPFTPQETNVVSKGEEVKWG